MSGWKSETPSPQRNRIAPAFASTSPFVNHIGPAAVPPQPKINTGVLPGFQRTGENPDSSSSATINPSVTNSRLNKYIVVGLGVVAAAAIAGAAYSLSGKKELSDFAKNEITQYGDIVTQADGTGPFQQCFGGNCIKVVVIPVEKVTIPDNQTINGVLKQKTKMECPPYTRRTVKTTTGQPVRGMDGGCFRTTLTPEGPSS